jgi:hypothetical protein
MDLVAPDPQSLMLDLSEPMLPMELLQGMGQVEVVIFLLNQPLGLQLDLKARLIHGRSARIPMLDESSALAPVGGQIALQSSLAHLQYPNCLPPSQLSCQYFPNNFQPQLLACTHVRHSLRLLLFDSSG